MSPSEPFVVAAMFPLEERPTFSAPLEGVDPRVEVVWTPYFESAELRSSKGLNQGVDPDGLAAPPISDDMRATWARADALIAMDLPADAAELFPNLKWFQGIGAGHDHIDVKALAAMGVVQTNASGIASVPIAEFVMARLLQIWKHLRELDEQQAGQRWDECYGNQLSGNTIGVVGLGAIGREVARRARAFGMTVLATRGSAKPGDTDPDTDELFPAAELDTMLERCDAVVIAVPARPETEDLFDADRFARMRPGSVLCNVGRGMHVVEPALIDALESGHLRAAVLDVARREPLPQDDPLWHAPNLYLSPHSSVSLDRYEDNVIALAADNLGRLLRGEAMRNVVNDPR